MHTFHDGEKKSHMELLRARFEYNGKLQLYIVQNESECCGNSNTSNLRHHLKQHHPQEHAMINISQNSQRTSTSTASLESEKSVNDEQSPIAAAFAKSSEYKKESSKWKSLTDVVTFCIAKDALPISTVEKPGFLHMLKQFDQ
jgi:hypothetical protein